MEMEVEVEMERGGSWTLSLIRRVWGPAGRGPFVLQGSGG